jgi:hypothetical protein
MERGNQIYATCNSRGHYGKKKNDCLDSKVQLNKPLKREIKSAERKISSVFTGNPGLSKKDLKAKNSFLFRLIGTSF